MTIRKDWLSGIDVNLQIFTLTPTIQHPTVKKTHLNVHCKKLLLHMEWKRGRSVKKSKILLEMECNLFKVTQLWVNFTPFRVRFYSFYGAIPFLLHME